MKEKHIQIRINQALELAKASNCVRRKFGALLLDPGRNVILADGYNGGPRGGGELCGGDICIRDELKIPSGTMMEKCCVHAEVNVICNAAANGIKTSGAWLIVNGEPCEMCARIIHHSGIIKVIIVEGQYPSKDGINYLIEHNIELEFREHPNLENMV